MGRYLTLLTFQKWQPQTARPDLNAGTNRRLAPRCPSAFSSARRAVVAGQCGPGSAAGGAGVGRGRPCGSRYGVMNERGGSVLGGDTKDGNDTI